MSDLAKLGIQVDTKDLEKGVASLNRFNTSSTSANNNVKMLATGMTGAARIFAGAVAAMNKGIVNLVAVTKGASAEQLRSAKNAEVFANSIYKASLSQEKLVASTNKTTSALKKQATQLSFLNSINKVTGVVGLSGKSASLSAEAFAIPRAERPNKFNTANIAAQFQDIAVTAQMGMNPMTIALQQGTQLSAILNSMKSPLEGIKDAFKSVINPVSLLTIAFVALITVGLQFVNWTEVGKTAASAIGDSMDFLANNIETLTLMITALSVVLLTVYGGAITAFITSTTLAGITALKAGAQMVAAWIMGLGPIAWIVAGIVAVSAALIAFKDQINNLLGFDLFASLKKGINFIIGTFVGMFKALVAAAVWGWNKIKSIWSDTETKGFLETIDETIQQSMSKDYVGSLAKGFKNLGNTIRTVFDGLTEKQKKIIDGLFAGLQKDTDKLKLEAALVGKTSYEVAKLSKEQEILQKLKEKDIELTPDLRKELDDLTTSYASASEEARSAKENFEFVKSVASDFFTGMRKDLMDGKKAWEAFGDAMINIADKILDKLTQLGVDTLFDALGKSGISWAGLFGSSLGVTTSTATGSTASADSMMKSSSSILDNFKLSANAKGNVFTNGIYDKPTFFAFANGGSFGVMGEAGPEAVMPLKRSSNGSLGVAMVDNKSSDSNVVINVINNSNSRSTVQQRETNQGFEIDVLIDEMIGEKLSTPGTASNTSLRQVSNMSLVRR